ncbi:hypothetical protein KKH30_00460, partial [Candidatus Micrarchaeota archaeon]|nr:hypothetical protein [Candidatus Micrarchaeota archaeon]MBU1939215.1 hypothetical protein [Candidatus Micrarchaeota archaeon]
KLFDGTLGAFKSTAELLRAEREEGREHLDSTVCIYSMILRMRALFNIQCFLKKGKFTNKKFRALLESHGFSTGEIGNFLGVYRVVRDRKKGAPEVLLADAERLFEAAKLEFLKTEEAVNSGWKKEIQKGN